MTYRKHYEASTINLQHPEKCFCGDENDPYCLDCMGAVKTFSPELWESDPISAFSPIKLFLVEVA